MKAHIILLAVLLSTASSALAGDEVLNGGDNIRFVFHEGKAKAKAILNGECLEFLESRSDISQWYRKNKNEMAKELTESKLEWVDQHRKECPQSACACTSRGQGHTIYLSFENCKSDYKKKEMTTNDTAKLLIHEASHHLGVNDEEFADAVAKFAADCDEQSKLYAALDPLTFESVKTDYKKFDGTNRLAAGVAYRRVGVNYNDENITQYGVLLDFSAFTWLTVSHSFYYWKDKVAILTEDGYFKDTGETEDANFTGKTLEFDMRFFSPGNYNVYGSLGSSYTDASGTVQGDAALEISYMRMIVSGGSQFRLADNILGFAEYNWYTNFFSSEERFLEEYVPRTGITVGTKYQFK